VNRIHDLLDKSRISGALMRVVAAQLPASGNALLVWVSSCVADRWSLRVICEELFRIYAQVCRTAGGEIRIASANTERATALEFTLDANSSGRLQATSTRLGEHPAAVLLACFYIVLARLLLAQDVVVGIEVHRRWMAPKDFIGPLAGMVPVNVSLSGNPAFEVLVRRVTHAWTEASVCTAAKIEKLFDAAALQAAASQPFFRATFGFAEIVPEPLYCPGLRLGKIEQPSAAAVSDFDVRFTRQSGLITCGIRLGEPYRETSDAISQALRSIILQMCLQPSAQISEYSLRGAGEMSGPRREAAPESFDSVLDHIRRRACERPDAIALVCGRQHISYRVLDLFSDRVAAALRRLVVGPEACVALLALRDPATLIGMLGIFKANAVYVPLDPAYPASQIAWMIEDCHAPLLLSRAGQDLTCLSYDGLVLDLERTFLSAADEQMPSIRAPFPEQAASIMFTSGSTGKPKGVLVSHKGMIGHVLAKAFDLNLTMADVVAQTASCSFDISIWQFLSPLVAGGRVAILDDEDVTDPGRLIGELILREVTVWETVPVLLGMVVSWCEEPGNHRPLSALRTLLSNAEALPMDLAIKWQRLYPNVRLINTYGATECSDDVTHYDVPPLCTNPAILVPLGRPIAGADVHILDNRMRPVANGFPGELFLGGPGVARGYLNQPALTAERFLPDPFAACAGQRFYRTGDLARRLPNRDLEFLGRADDQAKVRGHRVEPGQIAETIRSHPAVLQSAVIPVPANGGESPLAAFVVWRQGAAATEDLKSFLASRLPSWMLPASILECQELPVNRNGKLDRRALAAMASLHEHQPLRTPTQAVTADLFSEILQLPCQSASADFFFHGGSARKAALLISRIRSVLNVDVPFSLIYKERTVGAIASAIDRAAMPEIIAGLEMDITEQEVLALLSDRLYR
jgi:amino acid adenylation domain-containing protein